MWRHFHVSHPTSADFKGAERKDDDDNEEEEFVHETIERVQRDQDAHAGEPDADVSVHDDNVDDNNGDNNNDNASKTTSGNLWYSKIKPFIDHFRQVAQLCIFTLGTLLAIDEMMI